MTIFPNRLEMMRQMPANSTGAEIGVFRGDFSAELLTLPLEHLYLIDSWKDNGLHYEREELHISNETQEQNCQYVLERFESLLSTGAVSVLRRPSRNASDLFITGELDWVYLDADHTYEGLKHDLKYWKRVIKPDGFICGHDYTKNAKARRMGFGVIKAVDQFCKEQGWEMVYRTDEKWASYALRRKQ